MGKTAIGIDLGTTFSAAAWVANTGKTVMIPDEQGEILTPSVVLFEDTEIVVGREALKAAPAAPERVAQWVKRDMGAAVYRKPIRGDFMPPEVIQACILRKIKKDIYRATKDEGNVVITVPAYFDDVRRKATADAGEMAGIHVLDIVNEPTAAALAFGEHAGFLAKTGTPVREMTILVYDLGGGTFDATLLHLAPGDIRTLATDGDVQLGGHDWDQRLVDYLAEHYRQAHGKDPRESPRMQARLHAAAVEAKHTLSARTKATIRLEAEGTTFEVPITRDQFEEMTADLLERTAYTTRQILMAAGIRWNDVSRVLLVGGSSRMPMVERMIRDLSGLEPDHTVNPDEAVARGAALYARFLLALDSDIDDLDFEVVDVNAHSLGIDGIDPDTLRRTNVIMLPRNTSLPAKITRKFVTKERGQETIAVRVLQGENSQPDYCTSVGRTVIRGLPPDLPRGWPVEVTFEYGTNGRLNVTAEVPGTHRQIALELERDTTLSAEGLSRWKEVISMDGGFDVLEAALEDIAAQREQVPVKAQAQGNASLSQAGSVWETSPHGFAPPQGPTPPSASSKREIRVPDVETFVVRSRRSSRLGVKGFIVMWLLSIGAGAFIAYLFLSWWAPDVYPPLWG